MADGLVVRPECRHMINVRDRLAPHRGARPILISPVRLATTVPEAEGVVLGTGVEKVGKVGCVVDCRDGACWCLLLPRVERGAGQITRLAVGCLRNPGRPALGRQAHEVPGIGQRLDVRLELDREERHVIAGFLELPGIAAGEDAGSRWCALRVWRVGPCEQQALARHAVETGCADPVAAVRPEVQRGIVGNTEQDVRSSRLSAGRRRPAPQAADSNQTGKPPAVVHEGVSGIRLVSHSPTVNRHTGRRGARRCRLRRGW